MSNINNLFVFAHFDDEAFSFGTILKKLNNNEQVHIIIICGYGTGLNDIRKLTFEENLKKYKIQYDTFNYSDLTLSNLSIHEQTDIKVRISKYITDNSINTVYTNNYDDLHEDHHITSKLVKVVCRPYTQIKSLYECYVSGSTELGGGTSKFNCISDVSEFHDEKLKAIKKYKNYLKHSSSIESLISFSIYNGHIWNMKYAEIFHICYNKG